MNTDRYGQELWNEVIAAQRLIDDDDHNKQSRQAVYAARLECQDSTTTPFWSLANRQQTPASALLNHVQGP